MPLNALMLSALAAQVQVHAPEASVLLGAVDMPTLLADGAFSASDLSDTQTLLQAAGIDAPGHFSLFAAETAQGLAVILLLDAVGDGAPGPSAEVALGVETLLAGGGDMLVNHDAGGWWYQYDLPAGLFGTGTLQWIHGTSCAALAWTGLEIGSTIDLSLFDVGGVQDHLDTPVLQILDATGNWSVLETVAFDQDDRIDITMEVLAIPAPATLLLAAVALGRRRRR